MTQEQIKAKAKEYFPNDEFKQQIVIDAINWATKELQKENAELKRHIKADCIDCADYYKNKRLEKENAELKEKYAKNITDCDICDTYCNSQLTKAKELLERLLITSCNSDVLNLLPNCSEVLRVRVEAEQFLNSDVEK